MGGGFFVYKYQIINFKEIEEIEYRVDVVITVPFSSLIF